MSRSDYDTDTLSKPVIVLEEFTNFTNPRIFVYDLSRGFHYSTASTPPPHGEVEQGSNLRHTMRPKGAINVLDREYDTDELTNSD